MHGVTLYCCVSLPDNHVYEPKKFERAYSTHPHILGEGGKTAAIFLLVRKDVMLWSYKSMTSEKVTLKYGEIITESFTYKAF